MKGTHILANALTELLIHGGSIALVKDAILKTIAFEILSLEMYGYDMMALAS